MSRKSDPTIEVKGQIYINLKCKFTAQKKLNIEWKAILIVKFVKLKRQFFLFSNILV